MTKRYNLSKIMRRAWELVKKAAMSISEGLRKAWREAKEMTKEEKIERLVAAGANRWTKNGMDRLYINASSLGLTCEYYKTGNISDAYWNGERISNSKARALKAEKHYIDIADMSVHTNTDYGFVREALDSFIAAALA